MKDILTAPWMVEMVRTATNMYNHGWDERNGGNVSLLLEEAQVSEYLDVKNVVRTMDTGFAAPTLDFLVTGTGKQERQAENSPLAAPAAIKHR